MLFFYTCDKKTSGTIRIDLSGTGNTFDCALFICDRTRCIDVPNVNNFVNYV